MKKYVVVILLVTVLVCAGCLNKKDKREDSEMDDPITEDVNDEGKEETFYFPYTGKETDEAPNKRAIAVMVSNQKQDRPQSALSKADIVYEILVEGNITRFMAIFQSNSPEAVGPVRSAREYFFTLAQGYDAIYVYQGAANFINDMIYSRDIDHLQGAMYDNDGHLFVREDFRRIPFNSYLQYGAAHEVAAEKGYRVEAEHEPLLFLDDDAHVIGEDAKYVKLDYYGGVPIVEFKYNEETKKYHRYHDREETVELDTEEPIEIDNLFIIETDHEIFDDVGRRHIDIESGGKGYLLQRGKVQHVEWENQAGRITPVKNGEVVPFVPGQTWISFVQTVPEPGVKQQVTISKELE